MKYVFTITLAIVIVFCAVSFSPVVSADTDARFCVSSHTVLAGEDVDVEISIKNSPGISSAKPVVYFDSDLTLQSVTYNEALGGMSQNPPGLSSPVVLNWISLDSLTGDILFATLHFNVKQDASLSDKIISIGFNKNDICDIYERNVDFTVESGQISVVSCLHGSTQLAEIKYPKLTEPGYTGDLYCLECGEKIADGETVYVYGDANADGAVNVKDLVRVEQFIRDNTVQISEYADVDGNGIIVYEDIVCLCDTVLELRNIWYKDFLYWY